MQKTAGASIKEVRKAAHLRDSVREISAVVSINRSVPNRGVGHKTSLSVVMIVADHLRDLSIVHSAEVQESLADVTEALRGLGKAAGSIRRLQAARVVELSSSKDRSAVLDHRPSVLGVQSSILIGLIPSGDLLMDMVPEDHLPPTIR